MGSLMLKQIACGHEHRMVSLSHNCSSWLAYWPVEVSFTVANHWPKKIADLKCEVYNTEVAWCSMGRVTWQAGQPMMDLNLKFKAWGLHGMDAPYQNECSHCSDVEESFEWVFSMLSRLSRGVLPGHQVSSHIGHSCDSPRNFLYPNIRPPWVIVSKISIFQRQSF